MDDLSLPEGVWIEDKGRSFAVHTRRAAEPAAAFAGLRPALDDIAVRHDLHLELGRLVLELRPPGVDKGGALAELVEERGARTIAFIGDDLGDLPAFDAVDALRAEGGGGLTVASAGPDAPPALAARADLVLDGPDAVVAFLCDLAAALR